MVSLERYELLKTAGSVVVVGTVTDCSDESGEQAGGAEGDQEEEENENGEGEEQTESEDETDKGAAETAMVRVAHLSPDAPNVDVYVADEPVFEDVAYREVSDYLKLQPDTYGVRITAAGDQEIAVFDEDVEVQAD